MLLLFFVGAWEFTIRGVTEFKKLFIESQQWHIYVWTCAKELIVIMN
jgi:hypothetical protein